MSAIIGEIGDPIGVTKICLLYLLSNLKYVESIKKLIPFLSSSIGNFVTFLISGHLLSIPLRTNSVGTLVKSEVTSRDMMSFLERLNLREFQLNFGSS